MNTIRKTRKLPEQIADKLREMIIQEEMQTGSKLPAEAELMNHFGVSRSTVREAVKSRQTEHIVDIRQGQGTFLCAMPGLASDPLGLRFADQEELVAQLLQTRLLIEPSVAALAAQLLKKAPGADRVGLYGGIFAHSRAARDSFLNTLAALAPHAKICSFDYPPELGAIIHLMRREGILCPGALQQLKTTYKEVFR